MVKNPPANAGHTRDTGLIPRLGGSPWSRKWQPTPVFLPGESHGQRSLGSYSPWGRRESDTTERLSSHDAALRRSHLALRFALLSFTDVAFLQLNVCGSPTLSKSIGSIFPTAFPPLLSLSHFGNSCKISDSPPEKDYDSLKAQMMHSIF